MKLIQALVATGVAAASLSMAPAAGADSRHDRYDHGRYDRDRHDHDRWGHDDHRSNWDRYRGSYGYGYGSSYGRGYGYGYGGSRHSHCYTTYRHGRSYRVCR